MRKFTKEISALLAAAAVGTTAYASLVSASSEPEAQVDGLMTVSDDTTETTTEEFFAGIDMPEDTTEPPMAGEPMPSDEFIETTTEEIVPLAGDIAMADGDINGDGSFGVSDVVLLQKWLLAVPDTHLANWWAADYNYDGRLDVFDLCLMKRELIYGGIVQPTTDLRTKFPEYYDQPTTKGLEVYLWQDTNDSYKCGLLMGTNRNKTDEEIIRLTKNGATIEQMKVILASYNIDKDMIVIIPIQVSETSYEIAESDFVSVKKTFWSDSLDESISIGGKTFVYENDGIGGQFTISFNKDGTYSYYEGSLSSYMGGGTWTISDDTVILMEATSGKKNKLRADREDLVYIADGSDNFYYIHVKDGEKFTELSSVEKASSQIKSLSADDIKNVTLSAYPPEKSVELTKDQIDKMLSLLGDINLYEEDNSYNEYGGQWVQFDIMLNSGEKISLAVFNPFFIINRNGYRAEYEPCQALNVFANSIIAE